MRKNYIEFHQELLILNYHSTKVMSKKCKYLIKLLLLSKKNFKILNISLAYNKNNKTNRNLYINAKKQDMKNLK